MISIKWTWLAEGIHGVVKFPFVIIFISTELSFPLLQSTWCILLILVFLQIYIISKVYVESLKDYGTCGSEQLVRGQVHLTQFVIAKKFYNDMASPLLQWISHTSWELRISLQKMME